MTTTSGRVLAAATALLAALGGQRHAQVDARGLAVNLTASWPSSRFYPLLEASEFLAEENPQWFWRYVDALEPHAREIERKRDDVDALTQLAVDVAQEIAPQTTSILELSLSTRTYSVKVEMFRQLALDSGVRPCGPDADAWAVFYREKQCAVTVACSAEELKRSVELLADAEDNNSAETCVAAGQHDVELDRVDHKFPQPMRLKTTAILYGLIGSPSFYSFHHELKDLASAQRLEYIVRHYPKDSDLETLLQGYGVSLDIKNMEYKTIDDSKKVGDEDSENEADVDGESHDDDDDDPTSDEDVDGVFFSTLIKEHESISAELKGFRDQLVKQHDQQEEIKAWQLKDIGLSATREILDAKSPLKRLRVLSQDFPRHAKKLALSRKSISDAFRGEASERRNEVQNNGLLNRFLLNGILVDPMQRSFNIFDFMKTLKAEWSIAKKLAQLPLSEEDRETMLDNVREAKQSRTSVRIRVRGPVDGTAPLYINNIETDLTSADWPSSVAQLRRPAWNLIFLRKNMYEYVVAFDPVSPHGRQALSHIAFMRMRGAPIQWGLLASTKELVAAKGRDERDAIVKQFKEYSLEEKATGWHFAKLLLMARAKDATEDDGRGRAVWGFIEGVADEGGDITVRSLLTCYVDATGGAFSRAKSEKEAMEVLKSAEFDDSVMSMTEYLAKKHLPFECSLFNGVLKTNVDLQTDIMSHFGRDQPLYQAMARQGDLTDDMDLIDELLTAQGAYPSEFPLQRFYRFLFDKKPSAATKVSFRKLPIKPILTMKIDTPEAWNVQIHRSTEDLDNLRVDPDSPSDVRAVKTASFRLENLLVYGQCRDKTFEMYSPPNGLQLVLERDVGSVRLHRDTLVMKNLGYFQLQATPGVWSLHLARGRAVELYEILDSETERVLSSRNVIVSDFGSHVEQLLVRKRQGMEHEELLAPSQTGTKAKADVEPIGQDAGLLGSYWNSMLSLFGKKKGNAQTGNKADATAVANPSASERTGETIHVFSLATGHLYERFLKIMMSSVLKRTKNPVTFWLLENFLSPDFKDSIPALREKFGMDIRLVTYKWPNWLRQQTQKQRIIWGYKILFLDVLFPLGVQKIIYVDADQVVRADLKELWEMDLKGAPYGYTPFCDSRNVGYQFWRQGYWKDHLRGRPYHISALYVVDLALFRQMAAGDILRAIYDQLSADPNSLANLDQDLPNYAQHQISIFSLPQEWLWCESWCSDESKASAKTIDLCNNPKHKEPKLDMAKRVISGELFNESWLELDQEIREAEQAHVRAAATA
ncbi:hypothetical protein ATCC90586_005228 [Pythium insidiosum]|nr:hypothetical protein ATCC90586_005228 [Pythium insidiosum]